MSEVAEVLERQAALGQGIEGGVAGTEERGAGGLDLDGLALALRLHDVALEHEAAADVRVLLHRVPALNALVDDNLNAREAGAVAQLHKRKLAGALQSRVRGGEVRGGGGECAVTCTRTVRDQPQTVTLVPMNSLPF